MEDWEGAAMPSRKHFIEKRVKKGFSLPYTSMSFRAEGEKSLKPWPTSPDCLARSRGHFARPVSVFSAESCTLCIIQAGLPKFTIAYDALVAHLGYWDDATFCFDACVILEAENARKC